MRATRAWILIACVLAGCAQRQAPLPAGVAALADPTVEVRTGALANGFITIEARWRPGPPVRRPVIIGPTSDADWLLDQGAMLVTFTEHWELLRGLAPAGPKTPPPPPARYGKWMLATPNPSIIGQAYFQIIEQTATEWIPRVVKWVIEQPETDPERLGITGGSTHGFRALAALSRDHPFRAAVVTATCGDYHLFLRDSSLALDGRHPLLLDPAYEAWLADHEPVQHAERFTRTALMMLNGDADPLIPALCAERTADVLRRAYRRAHSSRRFRAILVPGAGHNLPAAATAPSRAWWQHWLFDRLPRDPGAASVSRARGAQRRRSGPRARSSD